jgi:hypothetical protein
MAIVQISRIQVRRGLNENLPQLAAGEMGWSTDTQQLYIGNGVTDAPDFAPAEGVTEILTEYTNFLNLIRDYTFRGTESGYTSITGTSAIDPVKRTLQAVLDENVSVKHFGAVGDGTVDDTAAIDRAIRQIYVSSLNTSYPPVRRVIRFPAGTYVVTSNIVVPPNCTLVGEGKNNTIISGNVTVLQTCDSLFQTGGSLGTGGATYPSYITVSDMTLQTSSVSAPAALVYAASDVVFDRVKFTGGNYGLNITGNAANIEVRSSTFTSSGVSPMNISSTVTGLVSRSNYFDTLQIPLNTGTTNITTLANGAGRIDYELGSGTSYRIGSIRYSRGAGQTAYDDDYNEPSTSLGANLFIRSNGTVICTVGSSSTLKYNLKQFI